jgi:hypothetical protein
MKTSQIMVYREIIVVCSEILAEHVNTFCGQDIEFLNVKSGSTRNKRWALKGRLFIPIRIYSNRRIYIYIHFSFVYFIIFKGLMLLTILVYVCLFVFRLWMNLPKLWYFCGQYFPIKSSTNIKVVMFRSLNSIFFPGDLMKRKIKFFACWVLIVYKEITALIC